MVKQGFKQTEIGLIPEDWEVKSVGDITTKLIGGGTPSRPIKEFWNGNLPWMTVKDFVTFNPKSTQEYITELGLKNSATRIVSAGELIIATRIALGQIVKYLVDVTINQDLKTIQLDKKIDSDYFVYFYRSIAKKIIEKGSGSTVLGLSVYDLKSFQIPLPPLPEQKAIAEVLSDTDTWIESLEKLIAKKRLIKQGAMQQLLTPPARPVSGAEPWEVKKLGDCLDYVQPTPYLVHSTEYNPNNETPVLTAGKTFILGYTNEQNGIFKQLPTIIFDDFTTATKYVDFPFKAKSSAMKMLIAKRDNYNLRFLFDVLNSLKFQAGDHKRHWIGEFQKMEI